MIAYRVTVPHPKSIIYPIVSLKPLLGTLVGQYMEQLDVSDGFDVHDYRHGLKLIKEDRETMQLENRQADFACPACGKPFTRLFITEKQTNTFGDPGAPFCLVRTRDELLLLTHEGN